MSHIPGKSRAQILMPGSIDEYVEEYSPVRVIDAFVDTLDMKALGFTKASPSHTGRPSYDPADLLKLYIYGYMNKMRSSRRLMTECRRNMEVMFLLNELKPDFRTISDFRKDNPEPIREVFREFVKFCGKHGIYKKELIAIDGTKVRAQNADDKCYNREILVKKIVRIDEHIEEYMGALKRNDETGEDDDDEDGRRKTPEEIHEALDELYERREKYEGYLSRIRARTMTQILETDPEAHRMKTRNGFHCCYNVQVATDTDSHIICEFEATGKTNDLGQLTNLAVKAKDVLDADKLGVVADKGYDSHDDVLHTLMQGIFPNVPVRNGKDERIFNIDYRHVDVTDEMKNSTKPKDIRKCFSAGIVPACLENESLSIEIQNGGGVVACFKRIDDKHVRCPMNKVLHRTRRRNGNQSIFARPSACRTCKNRCTASSNHKTVCFIDGVDYVPAYMFGKSKTFNVMPEKAFNDQHNRALHGRQKPRRVVIKLKYNEDMTKKRMCSVEHPFGSVKWYGDAGYVLCRGKRKVSAELGLSFLGYNIKRAIKMVGTEELIRKSGE